MAQVLALNGLRHLALLWPDDLVSVTPQMSSRAGDVAAQRNSWAKVLGLLARLGD